MTNLHVVGRDEWVGASEGGREGGGVGGDGGWDVGGDIKVGGKGREKKVAINT